MQYKKEIQLFVKCSSIALIGASAGWIYYQVRKTRYVLDNLLDTSVLKAMESPRRESDVAALDCRSFISLESETFSIYSKGNLLSRALQSITFDYAKRLISLSQSDCKFVRMKATKALSKIHTLDNWHCVWLSNMIDSQTAVGLARTPGTDKRLFKEPPVKFLNYNKAMLTEAMKTLLVGLHERSQHQCIAYFLTKVFVDEHQIMVDNDDALSVELKKYFQSGSTDIIPLCLESIAHHCCIEGYGKDFVELNGLPLLLEIYNRNPGKTEISVIICRILSFLSFYPQLLEPIFRSGWIGILASWLKHEDVRISLPAARALANLDLDDGANYNRYVYILHPVMRHQRHDVDVVFVHGLLGGVFFTWRQRSSQNVVLSFLETFLPKLTPLPKKPVTALIDPVTKEYIENVDLKVDEGVDDDYEMVLEDIPVHTNEEAEGPFTCVPPKLEPPLDETDFYTFCWPKDWLGKDCKRIRIIGINYNTTLSMWATLCPSEKVKFTLEERTNEMMRRLKEAGIGEKPILWVTHSMGGLIVKNMLGKAIESADEEMHKICLNTKGIVFYSTPHRGSSLANLSQATALLLWPSVEVQELRQDSPQLENIHKKFIDLVQQYKMHVVTIVETKPTVVSALKFNFLLVEPYSGNTGIGEYYEVPQDHLGICKPLSRYSFIYQKVVHMVSRILNDKDD